MFKNILTLFGIGLIALWIVGLSVALSTPYMTWLDGVGGLLSFIIAGSVSLNTTRAARSSSILVLSLCLFGLWLGGLLGGAVTWQVWWTFVAACAYLIVGIVAGFTRPKGGVVFDEHERPRRVA